MSKFHNIVEVHKNVFLSKNDPGFYRKYLMYHPYDSKMLWEYSLQLEEKREYKKSFEMLEKAAQEGHPLAKRKMKEKEMSLKNLGITQRKKSTSPFLMGLLWAAVILLFLLVLFGWWKELNFNKHLHVNEHHYYPKEIYHTTSSDDGSPHLPYSYTGDEEEQKYSGSSSVNDDRLVDNETTVFEITNTYQQSDIPQATVFLSDNDWEYVLKRQPEIWFPSDEHFSTNESVPPLQLIFYEEVMQLGLKVGENVVVTYPVAAGEEPLPFSKSIVTKKVVDPNGPDSPFGSRGIQLEDNYAIHGTNEPSSIGQRVTNGCLRLTNDEIENLYPFIPLNTPLIVSHEDPPDDPPLEDLPFVPLKDETLRLDKTPGVIYDWKG
ncbi:L,D-transpeptidase [Bacillus shivajii]|uniref:L,D-transpeptidase n=1 Tax=Bacillus shivajii TaxID=1983719 RepID=UPI001CFA1B6A|nr:L,D-transpeptidase [Bacillus shivajii]UCZ51550.1 L,D-transpeptidase [Bacillus shivajii]